jgi:hypothetical protein
MKRPWLDDRMKHSSRHKLNIPKPLSLFTTFAVSKTIGHHGRTIETEPALHNNHFIFRVD